MECLLPPLSAPFRDCGPLGLLGTVPTLHVETADTCVALCLGRGVAATVDGLPASRLPPPPFNGIKIASTHEKPIVSVKEGQCVGKMRGGVL